MVIGWELVVKLSIRGHSRRFIYIDLCHLPGGDHKPTHSQPLTGSPGSILRVVPPHSTYFSWFPSPLSVWLLPQLPTSLATHPVVSPVSQAVAPVRLPSDLHSR